jgi:hypothetical protein
MSNFAKLFQFEDLGQVLVKLDEEESGPEIRLYFQPPGLGVCSSAFSYSDDQHGDAWDKAELAFETMCETRAHSIVSELIEQFGCLGE